MIVYVTLLVLFLKNDGKTFLVVLERNQNNRKYLRVIGPLSGAVEFNLNYYRRLIPGQLKTSTVFLYKKKTRVVGE